MGSSSRSARAAGGRVNSSRPRVSASADAPTSSLEYAVGGRRIPAFGSDASTSPSSAAPAATRAFTKPFPLEVRPLFKQTIETDRQGRKAIYADPDFRAEFRADVAPGQKNSMAGWAGRAVIASAPQDPSLNERPLAEVAADRGIDANDLALDLSLESDFAARFRFPVLNYDEAEVAELLADPNCVVALSDAGAHASQLCDACYSTHLLGHWVRDKGAMPLEQAIHRLTQEPAELFGLTDRGLLAEGRPADVVVLDPATVKAGGLARVHDLPAGADRLISQADGIDLVVVNGRVIRRGGRDEDAGAGALPGKLLRGGAAA